MTGWSLGGERRPGDALVEAFWSLGRLFEMGRLFWRWGEGGGDGQKECGSLGRSIFRTFRSISRNSLLRCSLWV